MDAVVNDYGGVEGAAERVQVLDVDVIHEGAAVPVESGRKKLVLWIKLINHAVRVAFLLRKCNQNLFDLPRKP